MPVNPPSAPVGAAETGATRIVETASTVVASVRRPRVWGATIRRLWRGSLQFRTTTVAVAATVVAITIACVWMAAQIQTDLFESRSKEALEDASRAITAAQSELDAEQVDLERSALQGLMSRAKQTMIEQSGTSTIAWFRVDNTPSQIAPQNQAARDLPPELISNGLRERVNSSAAGQWWQSVELRDANGDAVPGLVVGQQLVLPGVGGYGVYFGYDLSESAQTLTFVQRTLWIAGIVLVLIMGLVTWLVLRSVTEPIVEVAETTQRLAAGDMKARIEVRGDDELAVLGSSFNQMADSIERQIAELAELSLVQQRFVSDVSHELRTPLTTIRLAADVLNDARSEFGPLESRSAELMHTQVVRFEELLTDLLEISRYDAGSAQLATEARSLAQLTEEVVESMRPLAEQHGTELRVVTPGGFTPVDMDPRRIRRILRNLIGNAIEHGEGRPIVITVDSDEDAVAVGVRDYGMGMSPDDSQRVFDRFWRADPSRQRTIGGTGLGLSIALGDAKLHGGALEVWSALGRGTNFVLTLPRTPGVELLSSPVPLEPRDDEVVPDVAGEES
ncbi:MtrAB system histidine kinase MtrB [Microbacterium sediminis]|uniref:MtrAB system histidine kinase MtrB n=1 Tax=Microbacterium sediminis TaxID=904291 RepID=UPI0009FC8F69|nr:MtrAB system histidine kinase MtrB [Microbacterium sediminis]QBR74632.1 HAMP domain-containing histidine kinase [Microbacterium sediminis]